MMPSVELSGKLLHDQFRRHNIYLFDPNAAFYFPESGARKKAIIPPGGKRPGAYE
ncbi:MAG: hypothetical protein ACE5DZ_01110 [Mariprofundus sp.]